MIYTISAHEFPILNEIPKLKDKCLYVEAKNESFLKILHELPYRSLGIVGSRTPQLRSRLFMDQILRRLHGSPVITISGMAKGIDAEAHRISLKYGLKTIGVLGHGFNEHYPPETENLRAEIIDAGGLMISEYPPEHLAMPYQFIHRNRIIAALSRATWVVQAGRASGALNTAKWVMDIGRDLLVTPCFPGDNSMMGNEALLQHPHTKALWSAEDLSCVWIDLFSQLRKDGEHSSVVN